MKPMKPVYLAAQAVTPCIGKGNPNFIDRGHEQFGVRENPTLEDHIVAVVRKLIHDNGLDPTLIQRGYIGNFAGELEFLISSPPPAMVGRCDASEENA